MSAAEQRVSTYLWSQPFSRIIIEIDHVEGYQPSDFAVEALVGMVNATTQKPVELLPFTTFPPQQGSPVEPASWAPEELTRVAAGLRSTGAPGSYSLPGAAVLHIVYLDGHYEEGNVLGVAIDATVFLFRDRPRPDSPVPVPTSLPDDFTQRSLLIHEVGHVFGLVDNGASMQRDHADPTSPNHSNNPASVMYRAIDLFQSQAGTAVASEAPPYEFDRNDRADLAAFQAREPR